MTPVRLRDKTPTVEWRSPDTTLPSQILRLLADLVPLIRLTDDLPVEVGDPGSIPTELGSRSTPTSGTSAIQRSNED